MKLDLTNDQRWTLEGAEYIIQEQIDTLSEQRDDLLYKCKGVVNIYKMDLAEQAAEIVVLINKLKQAQFALSQLNN